VAHFHARMVNCVTVLCVQHVTLLRLTNMNQQSAQYLSNSNRLAHPHAEYLPVHVTHIYRSQICPSARSTLSSVSNLEPIQSPSLHLPNLTQTPIKTIPTPSPNLRLRRVLNEPMGKFGTYICVVTLAAADLHEPAVSEVIAQTVAHYHARTVSCATVQASAMCCRLT
jgi:hypothetical protein